VWPMLSSADRASSPRLSASASPFALGAAASGWRRRQTASAPVRQRIARWPGHSRWLHPAGRKSRPRLPSGGGRLSTGQTGRGGSTAPPDAGTGGRHEGKPVRLQRQGDSLHGRAISERPEEPPSVRRAAPQGARADGSRRRRLQKADVPGKLIHRPRRDRQPTWRAYQNRRSATVRHCARVVAMPSAAGRLGLQPAADDFLVGLAGQQDRGFPAGWRWRLA
jgi:hypothetical protein